MHEVEYARDLIANGVIISPSYSNGRVSRWLDGGALHTNGQSESLTCYSYHINTDDIKEIDCNEKLPYFCASYDPNKCPINTGTSEPHLYCPEVQYCYGNTELNGFGSGSGSGSGGSGSGSGGSSDGSAIGS